MNVFGKYFLYLANGKISEAYRWRYESVEEAAAAAKNLCEKNKDAEIIVGEAILSVSSVVTVQTIESIEEPPCTK